MSADSTYYHLVPADVWARHEGAETYLPEAFDADGFIHLTIGSDNLLDVANRFYQEDPRDYLALTLDQDRISAPVRFDDDSGLYPHVYGPLNTDSVTSVRRVQRAADGSFVAFE